MAENTKEQLIGKVTHYYDRAGVAVIKLEPKSSLKKGDTIHFVGAHEDFTQQVASLQINHQDVEEVKSGEDFGLKVDQKVHENTKVYKA